MDKPFEVPGSATSVDEWAARRLSFEPKGCPRVSDRAEGRDRGAARSMRLAALPLHRHGHQRLRS